MKVPLFHRFSRFALRVLAPLFCAAFLAASANAQTSSSARVFTGRKAPQPAAPSREELQKQLEAAQKLAPKNARNAALQRFKIEQAQLLLAELAQFQFEDENATRRFVAQLINRAKSVAGNEGDAANLDVLKNVFAPDSLSQDAAKTVMHERAYLARNDGSPQPFWIFLPRDYSPQNKYPLALFLHGYNPQISKVRAPIPSENLWGEATRRGFIVAVPYGRRNTDFLGVGEDDALRVLALAKELYSIDDDRVFLTGFSMGGFGTLSIGLKNPDLFAGLAPVSARTDIYRWLRLSPTALPLWKRVLHQADDPRHLAENALNLPVFLQHGARDTTVPTEHSRLFHADLRALKIDVSYREHPLRGHELGSDAMENIFNWTRNRVRENAPRRIVFTTANLRTAKSYWAQIEAFREYSRAARIEVVVSGGSALYVETDNVAVFTLSPPASLFSGALRVPLRVNGKASGLHDVSQPIRWREKETAKEVRAPVGDAMANEENAATPRAASATGANEIGAARDAKEIATAPPKNDGASTRAAFVATKTPALCGPIREAYREAFLLVYGTRGAQNVAAVRDDAAREYSPDAPTLDAATQIVAPDAYSPNPQPIVLMTRDEANARRFGREWRDYADGTPPIKADSEITPDDEKNYNLILFGDSRSNAVLSRIGAQLPLELLPGGYRIGTREVRARGVGLQFCYPSPLAPNRLLVVQSGLFYGGALPLNHKFDLLPDFLVFGETVDARDSTNDALEAGFFDGAWQLPGAAP